MVRWNDEMNHDSFVFVKIMLDSVSFFSLNFPNKKRPDRHPALSILWKNQLQPSILHSFRYFFLLLLQHVACNHIFDNFLTIFMCQRICGGGLKRLRLN